MIFTEKRYFKVSMKSVYQDDIWDFSDDMIGLHSDKLRRIFFDSLKIGSKSIIEYPMLLESLKDLLVVCLNSGAKFQTVASKARIINKFLNYMYVICNKNKVNELNNEEINNYINYCTIDKSRTLESVRRDIYIIKDFYKYRSNLLFYIDFEPFVNMNITMMLKKKFQQSEQTKIIEDNDWKSINDICVKQLEHYENNLELETYIFENYKKSILSNELTKFSSRYRTKKFKFGYETQVRHKDFLIDTITACGIIIQMYTGMRISELMSLKNNCIKKETIILDKEEYILKYLTGQTYKYHKIYQDEVAHDGYGKEAKWLCPEIVVRSVEVLTKISESARFFYNNKLLENSYPEMKDHYLERKDSLFLDPFPKCSIKAKLPVISSKYKSFLLDKGFVSDVDLHSHCFRRTIARFFARNLMGLPIDILQDQFKHYSSNITMYYMKEGDKIEDGFTELVNGYIIAQKEGDKNSERLLFERINSDIDSSILSTNNVIELLDISRGRKLKVINEYMVSIDSGEKALSPIECLTCNGVVILPQVHLSYWEELLIMYENMIEFEPSKWNISERNMIRNVVNQLRNNNAYIVKV